jgi:phosphohistidine phosphatase SixA/8-oxo-dGTP pyrophosphatase MutT (NUDIX family)
MSPKVLAAGGVVWRISDDGETLVSLIHRPRYDDWSLPKGKLESGESLISCAYREIIEETNLRIQLGPFIGTSEYYVPDGLKEVSYWSARVVGPHDAFYSNNEADQMRWLSIPDAIELATRDSDKEILEKFNATPYDTQAFIMLRHAKALARQEWQGDDDDRPLDQTGQQQAKRMLSIYQVFGIESMYTSDAVRCFDTVSGLAKSLGIDLTVATELSEYTFKKNKEKAKDFVKELIKQDGNVLICSHNPVLPRMLERLTKKVDVDLPDSKLLPGEAYVLHHQKKTVFQVDRVDSPLI